MAATCEVVILGSGPYGLSAAAHLRQAGIESVIFGEAMEFWRRQMPAGMLLRSSWDASHIADPQRALTLDTFSARSGVQLSSPVPLDGFVAYGLWFQQQVASDLDQRRITQIDIEDGGFRLEIEDGDTMRAKRVVIAAGISPFAFRPPQFHGLPASLVSHTADHNRLDQFAHTKVVVVGGGQSAIETAVLLNESGADVEIIMRSPKLRWLVRSGWLHKRTGWIRDLLYPPSDVGPPGLNQLVARPDLFRQLPWAWRQKIAYRCIRPAAAGWLLPRAHGIRITTQRHVVSAEPRGDRLHLRLNDGSQRSIDHLILGTGYQVNVACYPFLSPNLIGNLRVVEGYPELNNDFETSIPGLYFLGAPAAYSFGPLMRFVSGTAYSARTLTNGLIAQRSHNRSGTNPRVKDYVSSGKGL